MTLDDLRAAFPEEGQFKWMACPACGEPCLVDRTQYDERCIMTPRCDGKLNPKNQFASVVRGRR